MKAWGNSSNPPPWSFVFSSASCRDDKSHPQLAQGGKKLRFYTVYSFAEIFIAFAWLCAARSRRERAAIRERARVERGRGRAESALPGMRNLSRIFT